MGFKVQPFLLRLNELAVDNLTLEGFELLKWKIRKIEDDKFRRLKMILF